MVLKKNMCTDGYFREILQNFEQPFSFMHFTSIFILFLKLSSATQAQLLTLYQFHSMPIHAIISGTYLIITINIMRCAILRRRSRTGGTK